MNENKNIDRLFREKFRDFEVAPPEMAWSNIEAELLKKKQKRRVIPLWYRVGGVAAILVIGLMASLPFIVGNSDADNNGNNIVNEGAGNGKNGQGRIYPTNDPIQPNEIVADSSGAFKTGGESAVASGKNNSGSLKTGTPGMAGQQKPSVGVSATENAVASGTGSKTKGNSSKTGKNTYNSRGLNNIIYTSEGVAHKRAKHKSTGNDNVASNPQQHHNTAVAQRSNNGGIKNNGTRQFEDVRSNDGVSPEKQSQAVAATPKNDNDSNSGIKNNSSVIDTGTPVADFSKASEAVANMPVANDSSAVPQENVLEKLLKEKELGKEKDQEKAVADNTGKWNIKPQMAPVFYNSIGNGSPIDSQLANNNKTYDSDLSYGLGINYAVSNRVSIRSGINTVNLSYATNDIQFYAALSQQTPNVTGRGPATIVVEDQGTGNSTNGFADEGIVGQKFYGSMIQKMGYVEVPLEMSYKVLNKRFGIDVIGGVSTLFLSDNKVSVVSNQGLTSNMGKADNLNTVHFSTNVGVGFRYRFWKAFEANFEPMFKYQLNTFSGDSGNFKPYFIGLYSGISFSF